MRFCACALSNRDLPKILSSTELSFPVRPKKLPRIRSSSHNLPSYPKSSRLLSLCTYLSINLPSRFSVIDCLFSVLRSTSLFPGVCLSLRAPPPRTVNIELPHQVWGDTGPNIPAYFRWFPVPIFLTVHNQVAYLSSFVNFPPSSPSTEHTIDAKLKHI